MPSAITCSRRRRLLTCLLLAGAAGCRVEPPPPAARSTTAIPGTTAERVTAVGDMLRLPATLRATMRDAHAVEERIGDGQLGPSDVIGFAAIRVAPRDVAAWRAQLTTPLTTDDSPAFAEPSTPVSWWLRTPEFSSLELYEPGQLTGRHTGWIGIHAASGTIYIYTFTL